MFNFWGIFIMVIIMIPNIVCAILQRETFSNTWQNRLIEALEQGGRYGCMLFMVLKVSGGGFASTGARSACYLITFVLALAYCILYFVLWNKKSLFKALSLSGLPSLLFVVSALLSHSIYLLVAALVFAPCHIIISVKTYQEWVNGNGPLLDYVKEHKKEFDVLGVYSNEIRSFEYDGKKYIVKTPLFTGDRLSPFWAMMKSLFGFSFEMQYGAGRLESIYNSLEDNGLIPLAPFVIADDTCAVFEYVEGKSLDEELFPMTGDNAQRLGEFAGYVHNLENLPGSETLSKHTDFWHRLTMHVEDCMRKTGDYSEFLRYLRTMDFKPQKMVLMMGDLCADQFLYNDDNSLKCLVDLDAFVYGPVEWDLTFWKKFVSDWESFKKGYEKYGTMPEFEQWSPIFEKVMDMNK